MARRPNNDSVTIVPSCKQDVNAATIELLRIFPPTPCRSTIFRLFVIFVLFLVSFTNFSVVPDRVCFVSFFFSFILFLVFLKKSTILFENTHFCFDSFVQVHFQIGFNILHEFSVFWNLILCFFDFVDREKKEEGKEKKIFKKFRWDEIIESEPKGKCLKEEILWPKRKKSKNKKNRVSF